jgi:hypothetical protein
MALPGADDVKGEKLWRVDVTAPSGATDFGTIRLRGVAMSPQELAHRIADQAWRLTHDLADAESAASAAETAEPGALTRETVVD